MGYHLKDLRHLKNLTKSMDLVCSSFSEDKKIFFLYHLLIAAEIVSRGVRTKLSDSACALIPKNARELLQQIRDDFIAHSGITICKFMNDEQALKTLLEDKSSIIAFRMSSYFALAYVAIEILTSKITQLIELENNRSGKISNFLREIKKICDSIKEINTEFFSSFLKLWNDSIKLSNEFYGEFKKSFDEKSLENLKESEGFSQKIKDLKKVLSELSSLFKNKVTANDIEDFCNATYSNLRKINTNSNKNFSAVSTKSEVEGYLRKYSDQVKYFTEKLFSYDENHLNNCQFGLSGEVAINFSNVSFYIIVINALFEDIDQKPNFKFKQIRDSVLHKFDEIVYLELRDDFKTMLELKLIPYHGEFKIANQTSKDESQQEQPIDSSVEKDDKSRLFNKRGRPEPENDYDLSKKITIKK